MAGILEIKLKKKITTLYKRKQAISKRNQQKKFILAQKETVKYGVTPESKKHVIITLLAKSVMLGNYQGIFFFSPKKYLLRSNQVRKQNNSSLKAIGKVSRRK